MDKYFLDTSIFVHGIIDKKHFPKTVIYDLRISKIINEFVVKEFRKILWKRGYKQYDAEKVIEGICRLCKVEKNPQKEKFMKLKIRDKNDKPIVETARELKAILVIEDFKTYIDVETNNYCPVFTAKEVYLGKIPSNKWEDKL